MSWKRVVGIKAYSGSLCFDISLRRAGFRGDIDQSRLGELLLRLGWKIARGVFYWETKGR